MARLDVGLGVVALKTREELLLQLWKQAEEWRKGKVENSGPYDWWMPDESQMVSTLDALREDALRTAQSPEAAQVGGNRCVMCGGLLPLLGSP